MHQRIEKGAVDRVARFELPPLDLDRAIELLQSWGGDDAQEQRETWEQLKKALDEDRPSDRRLFP